MRIYIIIILLISLGCDYNKENKVKVPLGEVGILIDSERKILVRDLIKEGTYTFKDSIYEVVSFPVIDQTTFSSSFRTLDSMQFTGFITVHYVLDTTKVFEMYTEFSESYYEIEFEPMLKKIFRETIVNYSSESLKDITTYNDFYNKLTAEINRTLPKRFLTITDLKVDSVVQSLHQTPFK